jgi:hypothetical protein
MKDRAPRHYRCKIQSCFVLGGGIEVSSACSRGDDSFVVLDSEIGLERYEGIPCIAHFPPSHPPFTLPKARVCCHRQSFFVDGGAGRGDDANGSMFLFGLIIGVREDGLGSLDLDNRRTEWEGPWDEP